MDHMRVSQSIESSFQRHSGGPQSEPQSATKEEEE